MEKGGNIVLIPYALKIVKGYHEKPIICKADCQASVKLLDKKIGAAAQS